jgi:hypothetical protein
MKSSLSVEDHREKREGKNKGKAFCLALPSG